jgi:Glu-tRNA(Gln) amidotransferase subunit E-like FAD-binding protein
MQLYKLQTSSVNPLLLSLDKKIKKNKPTQEQSNKYQMDKISVSRSRSASKCHASSYPALHDPEDALDVCHTRFLRPKPDAHRMYAQDQVVIHTVRM